MLQLREYREERLFHPMVPTGFIPSVEDPEGIYPYESYCETAGRPVVKKYRFVSIENERIRVVICPDLGGKVDSIWDKEAGKEMLFRPESVRAARILPRMAFISGGIEVSFPVSHTPVLTEAVHCKTGQTGGRIYVWCGEREVRCGMQWTVEYSLGEGDGFLTQRTVFFNASSRSHSWMSWSNAALNARPDTEFHFPGGRVLVHGDRLSHLEWEREGPRTMREIGRMTGYFWENPTVNAFGAYTPSLKSGLYHVADRNEVPGIKLWVYGTGRHEKWASLSGMSGHSYLEIQAGPLKDQSVKHDLAPGGKRMHTEFWFPSIEPLDIQTLKAPDVGLVAEERIPLFGWPERENVEVWARLDEAFQASDPGRIPAPPDWFLGHWPPSGMEEAGEAIRWAIGLAAGEHRSRWAYHLAVWLAGCDRREEALSAVREAEEDWARPLEARLLRCWKGDAAGAVAALAKIGSETVALHPQVVLERDLALAQLGEEALSERFYWLARVEALDDDGLIERTAVLLADAGKEVKAKELLESRRFEPVHQRYERSRLWERIQRKLSESPEPVPESLGEDDLAAFGLYRTTDSGQPEKS